VPPLFSDFSLGARLARPCWCRFCRDCSRLLARSVAHADRIASQCRSHGRRVRCSGWCGSAGHLKTSGTGLATPSSAGCRGWRCNGFHSIRAGLMAVAHDISRMLGWAGSGTADTGS
jgi:hypothetical protein